MYMEAVKRHKTQRAAALAMRLPESTFRDRLRFERDGLPSIIEFTNKHHLFVASHMYGRLFCVTRELAPGCGKFEWITASLTTKNQVKLFTTYPSRGAAMTSILAREPRVTCSLHKVPRQRPYGLWSFTTPR